MLCAPPQTMRRHPSATSCVHTRSPPTLHRPFPPLPAVQDIFNHILWAHKIPTEASISASKDILPDMSAYYSKFSRGAGAAASGSAAAAGGKGTSSKGHRR